MVLRKNCRALNLFAKSAHDMNLDSGLQTDFHVFLEHLELKYFRTL